MPFDVYILECSDGTYYTGHSDNLDQRMAQHGDGIGSRYTAKRRPLKLLWATDCQTREEAWELERRLHGWSRAKKEALMRGDFEALPGLARSKSADAKPVGRRALTLRQAQGERSLGQARGERFRSAPKK
ncbi:MAG TPA: GIY-YIG nuclease family protein [Sphingomicrobium sp.]|jgi:putative endonuclease|nr:GIY-YIG nuclease family protein [Sphingomicrobium sp.]